MGGSSVEGGGGERGWRVREKEERREVGEEWRESQARDDWREGREEGAMQGVGEEGEEEVRREAGGGMQERGEKE